jgi:hypothetical protein
VNLKINIVAFFVLVLLGPLVMTSVVCLTEQNDDAELVESSEENSEEKSEKEGRETESEKEGAEVEEFTLSIHAEPFLKALTRQEYSCHNGAIYNLSHKVVTPPPQFC